MDRDSERMRRNWIEADRETEEQRVSEALRQGDRELEKLPIIWHGSVRKRSILMKGEDETHDHEEMSQRSGDCGNRLETESFVSIG